MERIVLLLSVVLAVGICSGEYDIHANEFFTGFPKNQRFPVLSTPRLHVTTRESQPVSFTVTTEVGFNYAGVATPGSVTTIEVLDDELKGNVTVSSGTELDKAIHIQAEDGATISVHASNFASGSVGAFAVLPMHTYDIPEYIYYAVSTGTSALSIMPVGTTLLVSGADGTTVTIYPTTNISLPSVVTGLPSDLMLQPGQNHTITLNYMQTFLAESMTGSADMSGTKFVSNKPLSVITGHQCGNIPVSESFCDHIVQQVPPTAAWGRNHMALSFANRTTGAMFKIVAGEDTRVNITCGNTSGTGAPEFSTLIMSQDEVATLSTGNGTWCSFAASGGILVTQLAEGGQGEGFGDPLSLRITPLEQYKDITEDTEVIVPPSPFIDVADNVITETIISIFVSSYTNATITVDDDEITNSQWIPIYSGNAVIGYGVSVTNMNTSSHIVKATSGIFMAVMTYGFSSIHDAFGYPVTGNLDLINTAHIVEFPTINHTTTEGDVYHIPVTRINRLDETLSLDVTPCDGAVLPDTVSVGSKVTFVSGASQASVAVSVMDDKEPSATQCYCVELVQVPGSYMYLPQSRANICVRDNEDVSLTLLGVEVVDRQLEITVSTEGYEGEEGLVIYVDPVIRSNSIGKRDIHVRQVTTTPPIPISITRYLKQSLYSVPLGSDIVITEDDYITIESENNIGIVIPDAPIKVIVPTSSMPAVPSSTATATSSTIPSPTPTTTTTSSSGASGFMLTPENLNFVLIAVISGLVFALMLTCCVGCLYIMHTRASGFKARDVESRCSYEMTPAHSPGNSKDNLIASSDNNLSMHRNSYENTQSAVVPTKYSLDVGQQQVMSLPNSACTSLDTLVSRSTREQVSSDV